MSYGIQHLHSTALNSLLIGLEPSSITVNRDSRHDWLEVVERVTPHQAIVCTGCVLIREWHKLFERRNIYLFSEVL